MRTLTVKTALSSLAAVVVLMLASPAQAQVERELFLISYPNAEITVDGDASDWNLAQFGTDVIGGVVVGGEFPDEWERATGTGDIARLGWDDAEENVFYAGMWTGAVLPENRADNAVKFYARDNATHQYFLVDITDDEINTGDEAAWANDSVEFYFDPEDDGDPTDWGFDVQLVIDADNQVQVWNSPTDYELQVEAGVESAVTITDTGWLLEVGIDKSVFTSPLPAVLGPANDPAGNNYGIDLSYRDNDDPDGLGSRNGDPAYSSDYVWADPYSGAGFPSKQASTWGQMIAGEPLDLASQIDRIKDLDERIAFVHDVAKTWMGDANLDGEFNSTDLVEVLAAGEYEDNIASNSGWSDGDWNADSDFNSSDLVVALADGGYEQGPRPSAAAVPEPSAMALFGLALIGLSTLRGSYPSRTQILAHRT
jgi:hypothetical protein